MRPSSRIKNGSAMPSIQMVLQDVGVQLEILHVHETWLPKYQVSVGEFDF